MSDYSRLIRDLFPPPKQKEPCWVCGKYKSISHAHHVIPVSEIARLCAGANIPLSLLPQLPIRYIWLCPNHHAIFHAINNQNTWKECACDIDVDEFSEMKPVWDIQNWDELSEFLGL